MMITDSSKDVRKTALKCLALSRRSLVDVLIRSRDVNAEVRAAVFGFLRDKAALKNLSIRERIQVLDQGLGDRDETVLKACKVLIVKTLATMLKWL